MEKPKKKPNKAERKKQKVMVSMYLENWLDILRSMESVKEPVGNYWNAKRRIENRIYNFMHQGKPKE